MPEGPSMGGDVEIPALGKMKKSYVMIGVAAAAGIVGYAYYKHRQSTSALQQSGADAQYAVDQATTPGDYASGTTQDSTVNTSLAGQLPVDNSAWIDAAVSKAQTLGIDAAAMEAAVAKWEAHQLLTQDEANLVNQARALVGEDPPVGGPYPVNITSSPAATIPARVTNLSDSNVTRTSVILHFSSTGATSYTVNWGIGPITTGGNHATKTWTSSPVTIGGLKPNTTYYANVIAKNASGAAAGSNQISFHTAK